MRIEIDYNGSVAICKIDGRPFNYCNSKDQAFAMGAFQTIIKHWEREHNKK